MIWACALHLFHWRYLVTCMRETIMYAGRVVPEFSSLGWKSSRKKILNCMHCCCSMCGSDQGRQRKRVESKGACKDAYQNFANYHPKVTMWRRDKYLGQISDEVSFFSGLFVINETFLKQSDKSYLGRIHKRIIDLHSPVEVVKQITSIG